MADAEHLKEEEEEEDEEEDQEEGDEEEEEDAPSQGQPLSGSQLSQAVSFIKSCWYLQVQNTNPQLR